MPSTTTATVTADPIRRRGRKPRLVHTPIAKLIELLRMDDDAFAVFAGATPRAVRSWRYGTKHPDINRLYDLTRKAKEIAGCEVTVDNLIEAARQECPAESICGKKICPDSTPKVSN